MFLTYALCFLGEFNPLKKQPINRSTPYRGIRRLLIFIKRYYNSLTALSESTELLNLYPMSKRQKSDIRKGKRFIKH